MVNTFHRSPDANDFFTPWEHRFAFQNKQVLFKSLSYPLHLHNPLNFCCQGTYHEQQQLQNSQRSWEGPDHTMEFIFPLSLKSLSPDIYRLRYNSLEQVTECILWWESFLWGVMWKSARKTKTNNGCSYKPSHEACRPKKVNCWD